MGDRAFFEDLFRPAQGEGLVQDALSLLSDQGDGAHSASALPRGVQMVTDLRNVLRQEAARCRRLAELVTEQTIRQELMEMAARLQAIVDEVDEP